MLFESSADAPMVLVAAITRHYDRLLAIELVQLHGKSGFKTVGVARLRDDLDDVPDIDAHEIATEIYDAATSHRIANGGDYRFRAVLSVDGEDKPIDVSFSVSEEQVASKDPEGRARGEFIGTITAYCAALGRENLALVREMRMTTRAVVAMVPSIIELKMSAIEDRAEAMGISVRKTSHDEHWKETQKMIKELARGPLGLAVAAKMTGLEPGELKALVGDMTPADAPKEGLRAELAAFGRSLTSEQQLKLVAEIGLVNAAKLQDAAQQPDDEQARTMLVSCIAEAKLADRIEKLAAFLTEEQCEQLHRILELSGLDRGE